MLVFPCWITVVVDAVRNVTGIIQFCFHFFQNQHRIPVGILLGWINVRAHAISKEQNLHSNSKQAYDSAVQSI